MHSAQERRRPPLRGEGSPRAGRRPGATRLGVRFRSAAGSLQAKERSGGRDRSGRTSQPWRPKAGSEALARQAARGRADAKWIPGPDRAKGLLTYEELGEKLAALEETRNTARRELEALRGRSERLEGLRQDRDTLLERYAILTEEALEELSLSQRNKLYKILKLRVVLRDDGTPEVSGAFCENLELPSYETSDPRNDVSATLSV